MKTPRSVAYLKPGCGWSEGVRALLQLHQLPYEERDIVSNPVYRREMTQKSGQSLSPCVEIDGHMLADVGDEEVEHFLQQAGWVQPGESAAAAPVKRGCACSESS